MCQAYFLRSPDSEDRIALTFWDRADSMAAGGSAIGAWQGREAAAGRVPAFVGGDAFLLTDLRFAIAASRSRCPQPCDLIEATKRERVGTA